MDPRTRSYAGQQHAHGRNTCLRCGKWVRNFHEHAPFCKALAMSARFFRPYQSSKMCFKAQTANSQISTINVISKKKTKSPGRIARDAKRLAEYNSKKSAAQTLPFFNLAPEEFDSEIKSHTILLIQFRKEKENREHETIGLISKMNEQDFKINYLSSTLEKAYRDIQYYMNDMEISRERYCHLVKDNCSQHKELRAMDKILSDLRQENESLRNVRPPPQNSKQKVKNKE